MAAGVLGITLFIIPASSKVTMSASNKIVKPAGAAPDETELMVAQALFDLENNVPELKKELRPVQISAAKEVVHQLCVDSRVMY
ncbi:hypothetical protein K493DRAFT_411044 [Basidiobolus meristosporus CBS 931.73]|uniref:Uncharacterized protein n=1 Tax=Basidiobolus meristosporus CBS 931.73 TaxID=1314790 RepID=A0A1Y1XRI2_9FUNG|nr:hypothetical protein K493DRAFT_411044 [Basidiobolus meristosporus CBS 931.73]|eukprot:ORX88371.1 hypothetical protein K493DRAFT_411044 [Basidiobolus meristosporus CBS 931.73]